MWKFIAIIIFSLYYIDGKSTLRKNKNHNNSHISKTNDDEESRININNLKPIKHHDNIIEDIKIKENKFISIKNKDKNGSFIDLSMSYNEKESDNDDEEEEDEEDNEDNNTNINNNNNNNDDDHHDDNDNHDNHDNNDNNNNDNNNNNNNNNDNNNNNNNDNNNNPSAAFTALPPPPPPVPPPAPPTLTPSGIVGNVLSTFVSHGLKLIGVP
ncbi:asparagine-rich protein [Plasmodium sp. gorilla clade G3]|nr:asparagine-rich protein [Plasmodium sp. gorilla clade G3]